MASLICQEFAFPGTSHPRNACEQIKQASLETISDSSRRNGNTIRTSVAPQPLWAHSGRELFYRNGADELEVAEGSRS